MSRQTYFLGLKFNKKLIYKSPINKYQKFTNAYIYSIMVKIGNSTSNHIIICQDAAKEWKNIKNKSISEIDDIIKNYMTIPISPYNIPIVKTTRPIPIPTIDPTPPLPIIDLVEPTPEISINASAQRRVADEIKLANKKLTELEQMYNITTDNQIRNDLYMKIEEIQTKINSSRIKLTN